MFWGGILSVLIPDKITAITSDKVGFWGLNGQG